MKEDLTMADERGSATAVLLAFLSGAALGAAAALLLAPEPGPESRERLRRYARRAEENLRDLAGRAGEVYEEVVGQGKEFVESKKSALREAFDAGREAMKRERNRLRGEGSPET
jgi:gas vesicle protein